MSNENCVTNVSNKFPNSIHSNKIETANKQVLQTCWEQNEWEKQRTRNARYQTGSVRILGLEIQAKSTVLKITTKRAIVHRFAQRREEFLHQLFSFRSSFLSLSPCFLTYVCCVPRQMNFFNYGDDLSHCRCAFMLEVGAANWYKSGALEMKIWLRNSGFGRERESWREASLARCRNENPHSQRWRVISLQSFSIWRR